MTNFEKGVLYSLVLHNMILTSIHRNMDGPTKTETAKLKDMIHDYTTEIDNLIKEEEER